MNFNHFILAAHLRYRRALEVEMEMEVAVAKREWIRIINYTFLVTICRINTALLAAERVYSVAGDLRLELAGNNRHTSLVCFIIILNSAKVRFLLLASLLDSATKLASNKVSMRRAKQVFWKEQFGGCKLSTRLKLVLFFFNKNSLCLIKLLLFFPSATYLHVNMIEDYGYAKCGAHLKKKKTLFREKEEWVVLPLLEYNKNGSFSGLHFTVRAREKRI